jgi:hypothetical protein
VIAAALPMPDVAPVTRAVCPTRSAVLVVVLVVLLVVVVGMARLQGCSDRSV